MPSTTTSVSSRQPASIALISVGLATGAVIASSSALAQWSPSYQVQRLGLTAPEHSATNLHNTVAQAASPSPMGPIIGVTDRYVPASSSLNGQSAWIFHNSANTHLGFTGQDYTGSSDFQWSIANLVNDSGLVCGYSWLIDGVQDWNGQHAWLWNGTSHIQLGFTGPAYTGSAGFATSEALYLSPSGAVVGQSALVVGRSDVIGQDIWYFDGTSHSLIGHTGAGYETSLGGRTNFAHRFNTAVHVAGMASRFDALDNSLGQDSWFFDGASTTPIGLTGVGYEGSQGFRFSQPTHLSENDRTAGYSQRVVGVNSSNGLDAWVHHAGVTTQVGLAGGVYTGSGGFQSSSASHMNSSGVTVGSSARITGVASNNGHDAWIYDGTSTTQIGLIGGVHTGSAGFQLTVVNFLTDTNIVAGRSRRYFGTTGNLGDDAWIYDANSPVPSTTQIGLTGPDALGGLGFYTTTSGVQFSEPVLINDAGIVIGRASRYSQTGSSTLGQDAWLYDGTATRFIGLAGSPYTGTQGYRINAASAINQAGVVVGIAFRIAGANTNNGQDSWYYDPGTGITTPIIGSVNTNDNSTYSIPIVLTEDGFVLGYYFYYVPPFMSPQQRAFAFRPDLGFTDLGDLVAGGLAANGWERLLAPLPFTAQPSSIGRILGRGAVLGQSTTLGQSVFILTPEPCAPGPCVADVDDGSSAGTRDGGVTIDDLLYYLTKFNLGDTCTADVDDGSSTGTRDNGVTIDDLLYFLARFNAGC